MLRGEASTAPRRRPSPHPRAGQRAPLARPLGTRARAAGRSAERSVAFPRHTRATSGSGCASASFRNSPHTSTSAARKNAQRTRYHVHLLAVSAVSDAKSPVRIMNASLGRIPASSAGRRDALPMGA